ncbi:MAG: NRDE family protein [Rhodospirillales bacterium]|nr:NRDE family protein [Rhodospirillales bacterium]
MCTVVILYRPGHDWPLIVGANRDEMRTRPWEAPGRHWDDRPHVTAGRDSLAGGTWLGMNDDRLVAGILNRPNSLGPAPGKRSRGELPLDALDHAEARVAAEAMATLDPSAYRSFNMVIGDAAGAYYLVNDEISETIQLQAIPAGLSMVTAHDLNDTDSDRIGYHLPRFRAAPAPDPENNDWFAWETLLADRSRAGDADWSGAMAIAPEDFESEPGSEEGAKGVDFGTVCSSLIALPAPGTDKVPIWRFAPGMPGETPYRDVML